MRTVSTVGARRSRCGRSSSRFLLSHLSVVSRFASMRRPGRTSTARLAVAVTGVTALVAAALVGTTAAQAADPPALAVVSGAPILTGPCLDGAVPLTIEERRLVGTLPRNGDPTRLQAKPFAQQMIEGAGFQARGPALVTSLCRTRNLRSAQRLAESQGRLLWQDAVGRAQRKSGKVHGTLPTSDDRPLYWTRLQATAAIRQWQPGFAMTPAQRAALITRYDRAAHGMSDIDFPAGTKVKRVLMSGFDPYTLDGGDTGPAAGSVGNNIRHGNPSGAIALSLDGTTHRAANGTTQVVQAYTLPVNFTEFEAGYLEDTVGPWMRPGPRRVTASVTVSQAGGSVFNLEQWNARYHGTFPGNDLSLPCPLVDGVAQKALDNAGCNTQVPTRWGGPSALDLRNPPQWTTASLPVDAMIGADTGRDVPRPPGDTWPDRSVAFGVVWHTNFVEFPDCGSSTRVAVNTPPSVLFPPAQAPTPPSKDSCSYSGGGGNYLSNESAYRNTLLRDRLGLDIPAGHIHTPGMQVFTPGDTFGVSDSTFDAWRNAIVRQAQNLVHVVGAES